jgi:chromosome segregation ATPase
MSQHPDDFDEIPSIVPERDELVTHRKRKRGTSVSGSAAVAVRQPDAVEGGTSGWVIFFITVLFLGMVGTAGAGWHFYQQDQAHQQQALSAQNRLMQIENQLQLVDQSAAESSSNLMVEIQEHFSEIDKLWAARNALRQEVGQLTTDVAALKTTSGELKETVASHERVLSQTVTQIQARIDEINRNFAGMDNLGQQLTTLNADLNRTKTAMTTVQDDVEKRVSAMEQDIESINIFRLQINQSLTNLQSSVNNLQSRVGQ